MFIILLKFSKNREHAGDFKEGHMKWLKQGFDEDIFLLAGSIKPSLGGAIIAHNTSLSALNKRVDADPFVIEKIVTAEILEIDPAKLDDRLKFLQRD